jgi:predicted ribosome quality control (RQC) complex YloA/Tae2 family protein
MRRQLSSFDINVITNELHDISGSYIEKIYQISRNEIIIRVKNIKSKKKDTIYIKNGSLFCITQKDFVTPKKPSTFSLTLRKYLLNGRIIDISQHEFDRIIKIKIGKKLGAFSLIIELFSNGNIVLVDPEGKIILPLIRQTWASRTVKGKELYIPPPSQTNPFNLNKDRFTQLIKESNSDIVRTLAININLSGFIAEEICKKANIEKDIKIKDINNKIITDLYQTLNDFLKIFKEKKFAPGIVKKEGKVVDILPFKFESYENFDFEKIDNFTRGLGNFIDIEEKEKKKDTEIDKYLGKLNRQLSQQKVISEKLKKEIDLKKLEGDLIYLNYQELDVLLKEIKTILDLKDKVEKISQINQNKLVKRFDPTENLLIVNLKDTKNNIFDIKINFRKSVSENAEKAYNDNKKLRGKLKGAEKSIKKTIEQIEQAKKKKIDEEKKLEEIKVEKKEKIFWFEKFRWFISSEGNVVIGGKDIKSNELVVKKYLKEGDRYAHADIQGAPSIIIKARGLENEPVEISDKTLEEACIFASSYSKAWKQFAEAQAYWVLPEQVSKTAQSGEFVPKGAFIIRGKRNYFKCKLEVAVGKIILEDQEKIMAGPINSVKKMTSKFFVLEPGSIKKSDIARTIAKAFNVNTDKVEKVLPPGGVTIVKAIGVEL